MKAACIPKQPFKARFSNWAINSYHFLFSRNQLHARAPSRSRVGDSCTLDTRFRVPEKPQGKREREKVVEREIGRKIRRFFPEEKKVAGEGTKFGRDEKYP